MTSRSGLLSATPMARRAFRSVDAALPPGGGQSDLLGYRLRRAARSEMLYGGPRVTQLVSRPPDVVVTLSEKNKLPTLKQERNDMKLDWAGVQPYTAPNNMAHGFKHDYAHIKNCDLKQRHLPAAKFHRPSSELRVTPVSKEEWAASARMWTPLQFVKPVGTSVSVGGRQSGLRHGEKSLRQERLNQKGLGWKRIMRDQWQNDTEAWTYHPKRGY